MQLLSRYPLAVGAAVLGVAALLLEQLVGWAGCAGLLAAAGAAAVAAAQRIGAKYGKEDWRAQRERLSWIAADAPDGAAALPVRGGSAANVSIVAPCFNENERMEPFIRDVAKFFSARNTKWELIIVDDGSTDDSIQTGIKLARKYSIAANTKILPVKPNRGKGYAVKQGVFASSGELILMADSDNATDISEFDALAEHLEKGRAGGMGIVIGSRAHMEEASKATRSPLRSLLMHVFHFCVAFTFAWSDRHTELRDTQCGFKLFTREAARRTFSNVHIERWAFDVELLVLASRLGIKVGEVQVKWSEIEGSKVTVKSMVRMGMELLLLCVCLRCGFWKVDRTVSAE